MSALLEGIERLRAGNRRYVSGADGLKSRANETRRAELVVEQAPFAVVVGCSDSRVPPEAVFDQGLGDLFVIRVAGNVIAPTQAASVQFAVEHLGVRLVVVLGHTGCGAVQATMKEIDQSVGSPEGGSSPIVDRIVPSVEAARAEDPEGSFEELLRRAVRENVRLSVNQLRRASLNWESLAGHDELVIVAAEYSLETGFVEFFDEPPAQ